MLKEVCVKLTALDRRVRDNIVGILDDLEVNALGGKVVLNKIEDFRVRGNRRADLKGVLFCAACENRKRKDKG